MAIRIVCDKCGRDADGTKYIVPVYDREVLYSKLRGCSPSREEEVVMGEVNLCIRHRLELAEFLSVIK